MAAVRFRPTLRTTLRTTPRATLRTALKVHTQNRTQNRSTVLRADIAKVLRAELLRAKVLGAKVLRAKVLGAELLRATPLLAVTMPSRKGLAGAAFHEKQVINLADAYQVGIEVEHAMRLTTLHYTY